MKRGQFMSIYIYMYMFMYIYLYKYSILYYYYYIDIFSSVQWSTQVSSATSGKSQKSGFHVD